MGVHKRRWQWMAAVIGLGVLARGETGDLTPAPAGAAAPFRLDWRSRVIGHYPGYEGLAIADLDGDGSREVILAAATPPSSGTPADFWHILKWDGATYQRVWASEQGARGLVVFNTDSDGAPEIVVALDNSLVVYDGATREVQGTIHLPYGVRAFAVADVDSDGAVEAVVTNPFGMTIYDLGTSAVEYTSSVYSPFGLAIGNVDSDPGLEIVTDNGYVLDGATREVEWFVAGGFGGHLGDLDGDGVLEIVSSVSGIRVYDARSKTMVRSVGLSGADVHVLDVEGDGPAEIVRANGYGGPVEVYDGVTLVKKWSAPNPRFGAGRMAVGDSDNDGVRELMFGVGGGWSGPQLLLALDVPSRMIEWQGEDAVGPFFGLSYGDIDADGRTELLSTSFSSDGGTGDGRLHSYDAGTGRLEFSRNTTGVNRNGLWRVRNANVDADPQQEVFVATSVGEAGAVVSYDGLTLAEEWRALLPSGQLVRSLMVADVDLDGVLEVVAGTGNAPGSPYLNSVYVFEASTGIQEWQSPPLSAAGSPLVYMRIANVDLDPSPEIVAAVPGGPMYILDGVARTVSTLPGLNPTSLETADRNGDGVAEILISNDTRIAVVSPSSGAVVETVGYASYVQSLAVADIDGVAGPEYVMVSGSEVVVFRAGGCVIWNKQLNYRGGEQDSLLVADIDGDGRIEIVVNQGTGGFDVFEADLLPEAPCTKTVVPTSQDWGFEAGSPWPAWTTQTSTNFGTPLCDAYCTWGGSTAGPFEGSGWAWFGGTQNPERATLGQMVGFPASPRLRLRFRMRVGYVSAPFTDTLRVSIDGTPITTYREPETAESSYTLRDLDVTPFADGGTHFLLFTHAGPDGGLANFTVDNLEFVSEFEAPGSTLTIGDAEVLEGDSGTRGVTFLVTLSPPSASPVSVPFATAAASANAADFVATSGTLTFASGETSRTITVQVKGDVVPEPDESFHLNLGVPTNATLSDRRGIATITNDDRPPIVVTGAASSVTDSTATLNGTVNPNGLATNAFYEFGQTTSYGTTTESVSVGSGMFPLALVAPVEDLACIATHHFRIVAINASGTTTGADNTFTTSACPPPPTVSTDPVIDITQTGAMLRGSVNPNGGATKRWFEYGPTIAYGLTSPKLAVGSGNSPTTMSLAATGLACETTYHYRAVAQNSGGMAGGADLTFATASCPPPGENNISALTARALPLGASTRDSMSQVRAEVWYRVRLFKGRSYQFSIWPVDHAQGTEAPALDLTLFSDDSGATPATPLPVQTSGDLEGSPNHNGDTFPRSMLIQPAATGVYKVRVLRSSGGAAPHAMGVAIRETTLFSPWTSRAAGFEGFVELHNNTSAAITVTLRAYNNAGVAQGGGTVVVLGPNATAFRTAAQVGVPVGVFAGIVLTHDGAFGAVSANITTLSSANGLSFDAPFSSRDGGLLGPPVR